MNPTPEQAPSQGEVVISIHELLDRWNQIPDVEDAYIVGVWNEDEPEDAMDEYATHPFWPTPYLLKEFDAYTLARDVSEARSEEMKASRYLAFKMQYPATELFRIGLNTPVVQAPVFLRIRWGRGHPTIMNRDAVQVEMLPHQKRPGSGERCTHCQGEAYGVPHDCPTRRLNALAEAIQSGTTHAELSHLLAVKVWHTPEEKDAVDDDPVVFDDEGSPASTLHSLMRTSPLGEAFVGTCVLCHTENLTPASMNEVCPNPNGVSETEALLDAIAVPEEARAQEPTQGSSSRPFAGGSHLALFHTYWPRWP